MLVLSRPPYLRWAAAMVLVGAAFAWDLSERATVPAPFAATTIERGTSIGESDVMWRQVPVGLLRSVELEGVVAVSRILEGEPIVPSLVSGLAPLPEGWWSVPMDVPSGAIPGSAVRIVLADGIGVLGVVVEASIEDTFGIRSPGRVAVPAEASDIVALAAASGQVVVLFEP